MLTGLCPGVDPGFPVGGTNLLLSQGSLNVHEIKVRTRHRWYLIPFLVELRIRGKDAVHQLQIM